MMVDGQRGKALMDSVHVLLFNGMTDCHFPIGLVNHYWFVGKAAKR